MTIKETILELKKSEFELSKYDMDVKTYDYAIRYLMILDNIENLTKEEVLSRIKENEQRN